MNMHYTNLSLIGTKSSKAMILFIALMFCMNFACESDAIKYMRTKPILNNKVKNKLVEQLAPGPRNKVDAVLNTIERIGHRFNADSAGQWSSTEAQKIKELMGQGKDAYEALGKICTGFVCRTASKVLKPGDTIRITQAALEKSKQAEMHPEALIKNELLSLGMQKLREQDLDFMINKILEKAGRSNRPLKVLKIANQAADAFVKAQPRFLEEQAENFYEKLVPSSISANIPSNNNALSFGQAMSATNKKQPSLKPKRAQSFKRSFTVKKEFDLTDRRRNGLLGDHAKMSGVKPFSISKTASSLLDSYLNGDLTNIANVNMDSPSLAMKMANSAIKQNTLISNYSEINDADPNFASSLAEMSSPSGTDVVKSTKSSFLTVDEKDVA